MPSIAERHGGPSKSVPALCDALARDGHEISLLTTVEAPAAAETYRTAAGVTVTAVHRDFPTRLGVSRALRKNLAEGDFDIIHHHALWLRTLHYAAEASRRSGSPLVISPRGMMSDWAWHHHRWRKWVAGAAVHPGALSQAAAWHATSHAELDEIRGLGFTQSCCVAPNGVGVPSPSEIDAARAHWHRVCPETAIHRTAVFYGRFHEKKRVIELIDLWMDVAPRDWFLLMVGLPEQYSPDVLNAYVHHQMGGKRIRVFSGAHQPPPYAAGELFLLPSHNENFGMTVAEALAHGVPALVTDTTPWNGLERYEAGWCVPWPDFKDALRRAMNESKPALIARGSRGRTWVQRAYAWNATTPPLVELYRGLLRHG